MNPLLYEVLHGASLILLYLFMIFFAKIVNDLLTPYQVDDELVEKDNLALSTSISGYFLATTIVYIGALLGPSHGIVDDLLAVGQYGLLGIALLNFARWVNDKLILYQFSNVKEIIEDRNVGTGAVQFGSYVASGLIVAGSIHGEGGGILTALAFFALGQLALIVFTWIYNRTTSFDIHAAIEDDNVAAGVAFGGTLIAVGIVLMRGAAGNFISWPHNLMIFGQYAVLVFILLPAMRYFFDKIMIPHTRLDKEIAEDRNVGAGLMETMVAIGFSTILFFSMS